MTDLSKVATRRTVTRIAAGLGVARVLVGTGLAVRPAWLTRSLGVDSVTARRTGWTVQLTAGREIGLGVGTLAAVAAGSPLRPWLIVQALADGADAAAFAGALRRGEINGLGAVITLVAGGGSLAWLVVAAMATEGDQVRNQAIVHAG